MDPEQANAEYGLVTSPISDHGLLLYVGTFDDRVNERFELGDRADRVPAELVKALEWAHEGGYRDWIRCDRDGDLIDGLPVHDW